MKNFLKLIDKFHSEFNIRVSYQDNLYGNYDGRDKYEIYMQRALNQFRLIVNMERGPKYQRLWDYLKSKHGFICELHENSEGPEVCFEKDEEYFYGPFHEGADDLDIFEVCLGIIRMYIEYKMRKDQTSLEANLEDSLHD